MEHSGISFYTQYKPSSYSEDQEKIEEWLTGATLNTPDINPEFFNEVPLFIGSDKLDLMKPLSIKEELDLSYMPDFSTLSGNGTCASLNVATTSYNNNASFNHQHLHHHNSSSFSSNMSSLYDRSENYSPYSEKLESSTININSPEMMPVSPNKVCPQLDSYIDSADELSNYSSNNVIDFNATYDPLTNTNQQQISPPNSRSSSISSGSGDLNQHFLSEYQYFSTNGTMTVPDVATSDLKVLCRVEMAPPAASPALSHYSNDSMNNKTFINLDNVPSVSAASTTCNTSSQLIQIKQEPIDTYHPIVIEEFNENGSITVPHLQSIQSNSTQQSYQQTANSTIDATSSNDTTASSSTNDYYQYSSINILPSTVATVLQQQSIPAPTTTNNHHHNQTLTNNGRKRAFNTMSSDNANTNTTSMQPSTSAAIVTPTTTQSTTGGTVTKKPRMTKREKQKMMENDINKFENENRDLRQSINLLERQITFCKRFLSENVAPVIQRQQQQQICHNSSNLPSTFVSSQQLITADCL